jgi:tetratricopeptide (TPR) repeat protein
LSIHDEEKKIEYAKKAMEFYEKIEQKSGVVYYALGVACERLGKKEKTIENYKEAEKAYKEEGETEKVEEVRKLILQLEKK